LTFFAINMWGWFVFPPSGAVRAINQVLPNAEVDIGGHKTFPKCGGRTYLFGYDFHAQWARQKLAAKNRLIATDAQHVEKAFAAKLAQTSAQSPKAGDTVRSYGEQSLTQKIVQIEKSVLAFPEPRRVRDRDHIRYIVKQPCLVCGRRPSDPHHLRFAQLRAHRCGNEATWWQSTGIDPLAATGMLWLETHPLGRSKTATVEKESSNQLAGKCVAGHYCIRSRPRLTAPKPTERFLFKPQSQQKKGLWRNFRATSRP
jgi:hypothetical protein